jgi:amino acid transporter
MTHEPPPRAARPQLLRAIDRWSMVALVLNSILGSGIFGLPSSAAALLGAVSPAAVLLAGVGMSVIIACYAEVASQFTQTGGTYLYVRETFGRWAGLQVGWLTLLSRLTACAAAVNLLVLYLGEFWPAATQPLPRLGVITVFLGTLAAVNYRGVGAGTWVSNTTIIAKLVALAVLGVAGVVYLAGHARIAMPPLVAHLDNWLQAMLLLLFAYGGYEAALNPMGEARDPRRDVVFALFVALIILIGVYTLLQLIVVGVVADAAHSSRPLADAARVVIGPAGAALVSAGALLSVYGYIGANMLTTPRAAFALAEHGDFPRWFAAVHPRFRTPHYSIVAFALLLWAFSQLASFSWNLTLSAVARLLFYAAVCVAVPVLRRRQPGAASWRLPGGLVLPVLGVSICAALLTRVDFSKSLILLATIGAAAANWFMIGAPRRALPPVREADS